MSVLSWASQELLRIIGKPAPVLAEYAINEARKPACSTNILNSVIQIEADESKHAQIAVFVRDLIDKVRTNHAVKQVSNNDEKQRKIALLQSNARFVLVDDQPIIRDRTTLPRPDERKQSDSVKHESSSNHAQSSSRKSDVDKSSRRKRSRSRSDSRSPSRHEHRSRDSDRRSDRRDRDKSQRTDRDSARSSRDSDRSARRDDDRTSSRDRRVKDEFRSRDDHSRTERPSRWGPSVESDDKKSVVGSSMSLGVSVKPAYHMPDSYVDEDGKVDNRKRFGLLDVRDDHAKKSDGKSRQLREYELWEQEQLKHSNLAVGVDRLVENTPLQTDPSKKQYDFVFEDAAVSFEHTDSLPGQNLSDNFIEVLAPTDDHNNNVALTPRAELDQTRRSLPIYPYRESLLKSIDQYQALIVVGETGSGKTTQIMQYLYESGYCSSGQSICCTQPRRVAAMSVAARVAEEVGCELGSTVGYSIRFEDRTSAQTRIKYMTDGMLIRELMTQPNLDKYSVIMIDEAHERTLSTDVLFGFIKTIMKVRPKLKVLISSATIAAEKFSQYFNGAPLFFIPGRRYPVDVYYTKQPEADYVDAAVASLMQIHRSQPLGDVLVFLTGQEEIEQAMELIEQRLEELKQSDAESLSKSSTPPIELLPLPLYSALPVEAQSLIFEPTPANTRKVVLATNIAETSLTIHGIVYVIDCGFSKQKTFSARTGLESLVVTPISRASANQRAGRAGRLQPGKCFRLYTKHAFYSDMLENAIPEIQRTNLVHAVLMLKSLKIDDVLQFDYMDPPPGDALVSAVNELTTMDALDRSGKLTDLGRRMSELPVEPHLAKTLLGSERYECSEEMLSVCAMLGVGASLFTRPKAMATQATAAHRALAQPSGDHLTLLHIYQEWSKAGVNARDWCFDHFIQHRAMKRAKDIRQQLAALCSRVQLKLLSSSDSVKLLKALASGFFHQLAKLDRSGTYRTFQKNLSVSIHPSSTLIHHQPPPRTLIYHELVLTKKEYMRNCSIIEFEWLTEIAPHVFNEQRERENRTGRGTRRDNPNRAERERHRRAE